MTNLIEMNKQELHEVINSAFKRVDKKKMLSSELKELLNFNGDGKIWGNFLLKISKFGIVAKQSDEKPVKIGSNKYFYYSFIENHIPTKKTEQVEPRFVIFNATTNKYEQAIGHKELKRKILILTEDDEQTIEIYQFKNVVKIDITNLS